MRIAVLADIHGNLPAFEAALAHSRRQAVDHLVIAGDLINGAPDSRLCWQLAQT
jgi:predicted phosphodiesterase